MDTPNENQFEMTEEKLNTDEFTVADLSENYETERFNNETYSESLEKFKLKINFLKWVLGSFVITLITFIINWGFKDREKGMEEITQYEKFATEIIVLNDNPVNKRMLAQYFANVTPSQKLRKGWKSYYSDVEKDYREFIREDSIARVKLGNLLLKKKRTVVDSMHIDYLKAKLGYNDMITKTPIVIPDINNQEINQIIRIQYTLAKKEEAEKIKCILLEEGFEEGIVRMDSIFYDRNKSSKNSSDERRRKPTEHKSIEIEGNQIRFFWENDRTFAEAIQKLLSDEKIETTLEFASRPNIVPNSRNKQGTIVVRLR